MTSGLGVYQLYVNRRVVGEEILKPGFTHYEKTKLSFTYDVTDLFSREPGAVNELAVQVTPGWWADKIITPGGHEGMIGKKVAFRGVLEVTYSDGSKDYFGTNTDEWKAGIAGRVKHAAIFDGEDYDARQLPGYASVDKFSVPEKNNEFQGKIFPSDGAEVYFREDLALLPVKAYTWKGVTGDTEDEYGTVNIVKMYGKGKDIILRKGETLVVDFGQNCAAVPEFEFKAKEGTRLSCRPSEILNDGNGSKSRGMDGPEGSCHRLYQWADWLSYEPLESCSGRKDYQDYQGNWHVRPETYEYWNYLSGSYWLMDAEMMCDMANAIGRDGSHYRKIADETRNYLRETFFRADGTFLTEILNTMQTPALFALKNNLFEGKAKENIINRLRKNFAQHDNCLQTGFLGTSILMPTLTENGMSDIAYELLFQRKNPSWLYSVDNGATTIWERWNSYMIEHGMGPQGMNSFNHYAYGCVGEWMWETMAGIASDSSAPGFRRIVMKPVPDRRLGFVKAEYSSTSGVVKSHWKYEGDKWIWNFTVPEGAVADVALPGDTATKEYSPGSYSIVCNPSDNPEIFR